MPVNVIPVFTFLNLFNSIVGNLALEKRFRCFVPVVPSLPKVRREDATLRGIPLAISITTSGTCDEAVLSLE